MGWRARGVEMMIHSVIVSGYQMTIVSDLPKESGNVIKDTVEYEQFSTEYDQLHNIAMITLP